MLGVIITLLIPLYLIGPEILSRFILSLVVQRRIIVQTRGEEITRGVLWALIPLLVAYIWAEPKIRAAGGLAACRYFFLTAFSSSNPGLLNPAASDAFTKSAKAVFWINWAILGRLYFIVALLAVALDVIVWQYQRLRSLSENRHYRALLARLVLPRIAEWHLLLSGMLAHSKPITTSADVLSKVGILYKGIVYRYSLTSTGDLASLTLQETSRFRREEYLKKRELNPGADLKKEDYWTSIPGNLFTILISDVSTINVRHSYSAIEKSDKRIRELIEQIVLEARSGPAKAAPPST
jgi:hypothetical protein